MRIDGPAMMSHRVKFHDSGFNGFCMGLGYLVLGYPHPFGWDGSTPKILFLVIVRHRTKFSSSSYNSWSIEITGMNLWDPASLDPGMFYPL